MIDKKRSEETERNIKQYLIDGLLTKTKNPRSEILSTYKRNYKDHCFKAPKCIINSRIYKKE